MVNKIMNLVLGVLISKLEDLGGDIVFANFEKIIINTKK